MQNSPGSERAGTAVENAAEQPQERDDQQKPDLAAELAQMEDRWKRALADLDNFRKRTARERQALVADAREAAIRDWLEAIDSVDRALTMHADPDDPAAPGLRAVLDQMEAILARQGITRVGRPGEPFDPSRHEAISVQEAADVPENTVVSVARSGYAIGDRVIRPAQVVVSRAPRSEH